MQSLATGVTIQKQTINTFVTVLNYEERIRSSGEDERRHYFPTDAVDEAKEYVSFENMINNQLNTSQSKKKMKDVSYAFFPVVVEGQYYVIVFNLLKANAEILDNEKDCDYNKYKKVFGSVKALFLRYLKKYQHPCVDKLTKEKPVHVLKLKWKTEKNKIDSGLYTMMHMELVPIFFISDDGNDDGSQLADENKERYRKEKHSNDDDDDEIVAEVQKDERNETRYTTECSQPTFDLGASPTYEKMKILSEKKEKMGLKSKYVYKTFDPAVELTEDEKLLGRSIFSTQEEEEMNIQSLAPGLEIDTSVIDAYVLRILEDKTKEIDKKIDGQYDRFHEMLSIQMENDVEKMQMMDVEL
nr:hypothetical protein [Tanacetum cinerariifolium]